MKRKSILRELRGTQTQDEVAAGVGVSKSAWAMYERGERTPRDEVKIRISAYFGVSVQDIFFSETEHEMCSVCVKNSA